MKNLSRWQRCGRRRLFFRYRGRKNTRHIYKTLMTCVKSVFLRGLEAALGGTKALPQSVLQSSASHRQVTVLFFFVYSEIKSMERGPMNTKTQSLIHRKAHTLQKCCHLVPEEVVFILQRSSSPSASLALALIER